MIPRFSAKSLTPQRSSSARSNTQGMEDLTQPDLDNLGFSAAAASSAVRGFGSSDDGG